MQPVSIFVLVLAFIPSLFGQDGMPAIKAEVKSAFVWGEDSGSGAVSSTIQDPLTGNTIRRLSYAGIEVSSRMGFERVSTYQVGIFLNQTTTIVNSTAARLSVRYGGISVDGRTASPLRVVSPGQKLNKRERKKMWHGPNGCCRKPLKAILPLRWLTLSLDFCGDCKVA